ncbi:hypothetical protein QBC38DRAFT_459048, partial [Podospora fimiseda]
MASSSASAGAAGSGQSNQPTEPLPAQEPSVHDHGNYGWPLLAKLMSTKPEYEAFGLFEDLHIKNLLYYQVELSCIQQDLAGQERADLMLSKDIAQNDENEFYTFADKMIGSETEQWGHVVRLRRILKEYDDVLLRYAQVSNLPKPTSKIISTLVQWLMAPMVGNSTVRGRGSEVWRNLNERATPEPSTADLIIDLFEMNHSSIRTDLVAPRKKMSEFTKRQRRNLDVERAEVNLISQERRTVEEPELKDLRLDYIIGPVYIGKSLFDFISKSVTFTTCMLPIVAVAILFDVDTLPRQIALIVTRHPMTESLTVCQDNKQDNKQAKKPQ